MSTSINLERQLLEEAASSPVAAVMRVSLEIDRELQKILAVLGLLNKYSYHNLVEAIEVLATHIKDLPPELKDAVGQFQSLRNVVVHGAAANEHLALRALDYGFRILRLLQAVPRFSYVVLYTDVPLYADERLQILRHDVRGVAIQTFSPDGTPLQRQVFPSTRIYYPGEKVTWEWNTENKTGWGRTWFRDPEANAPILAWDGSLEFTGRDLNQI